jgi:hypothetical protein
LSRGPGGLGAERTPNDDLSGEVRPYLITGGRTSLQRVDVAMETVVVVSDRGRVQRFDRPAFERARVLAECEYPTSVAEVAARLGVPLMVALIVVGDLVGEGLLEASVTDAYQAEDVAFLERLIHGVTAL